MAFDMQIHLRLPPYLEWELRHDMVWAVGGGLFRAVDEGNDSEGKVEGKNAGEWRREWKEAVSGKTIHTYRPI